MVNCKRGLEKKEKYCRIKNSLSIEKLFYVAAQAVKSIPKGFSSQLYSKFGSG
jgi:hypothetical protein